MPKGFEITPQLVGPLQKIVMYKTEEILQKHDNNLILLIQNFL